MMGGDITVESEPVGLDLHDPAAENCGSHKEAVASKPAHSGGRRRNMVRRICCTAYVRLWH